MTFANNLRGWIFYFFLAISIIVLTVLLLCSWPFMSYERRYEAVCRPWAKCVLKLLDVICGVRWRAKGMENMPDIPCVVLVKHQSAWDPFWLGAFLKHPPCFIYKKSLHWIPCLGWALASMNMMAIDRSKGRQAFEQFMRRGPEFEKRGWWVTLFPEGTRVPMGEHVRWKTGGARFSCSAGLPILPIAHNAAICWPKNSVGKCPGVIDVEIGPLIETKGRDPHTVTAEVEAWIEGRVNAMPQHAEH